MFYFSISAPAKGNDISPDERHFWNGVKLFWEWDLPLCPILDSVYLCRGLIVLVAPSSVCLGWAFDKPCNRRVSSGCSLSSIQIPMCVTACPPVSSRWCEALLCCWACDLMAPFNKYCRLLKMSINRKVYDMILECLILFLRFIFRERGREGETEGETHHCVVSLTHSI